MEVESKTQAPVVVRTTTSGKDGSADAKPSGGRTVSDTIARSLEAAQTAIDIKSGLAEARRNQAASQVSALKEQAGRLRVLSLFAPAAFAEFVTGMSKQLSATVSAYAQGGDPVAIRKDIRNLAEWVVRIDQQEAVPAEGAGEAGRAGQTGEVGGATWEDLVTEVRAWLAEDDARLAASRRSWFGNPKARTPEQAQDRALAKEAREVQLRLESMFTIAVSGIDDADRARDLSGRHRRTMNRLDEALITIDGWSRGISVRPPVGGLSILA
ncbi:hypothetical protein ACFOGJ_00995 [Marinibaculum pumilum]|uniref:Uncharacterized protein n=1 Tax=Marinibaculum pumilum TaxID=1766165 RepID=A0ABV7KTW6_9PROT